MGKRKVIKKEEITPDKPAKKRRRHRNDDPFDRMDDDSEYAPDDDDFKPSNLDNSYHLSDLFNESATNE
jgi:hypothetical protein